MINWVERSHLLLNPADHSANAAILPFMKMKDSDVQHMHWLVSRTQFYLQHMLIYSIVADNFETDTLHTSGSPHHTFDLQSCKFSQITKAWHKVFGSLRVTIFSIFRCTIFRLQEAGKKEKGHAGVRSVKAVQYLWRPTVGIHLWFGTRKKAVPCSCPFILYQEPFMWKQKL